MMIAQPAVIGQLPFKITFRHHPYLAAATTDNGNIIPLQYIFGALAHIPGQHHPNPHLMQNGCDTGLASASLRSRQLLLRNNILILIHRKYSVKLTMAEMIVHLRTSCRNRYFHNHICYIKGAYLHMAADALISAGLRVKTVKV